MIGNGIAAAVVNYACEYQHYPLQMLEILAAITYIRRNSERLHIDPEKIAVMGFSAGGHAACTAGKYTHSGSMKCLLGDDPDPELFEKMSLEKQVTENAPHAFIWHTSEDGLVPLENSLYIAEALHEKGIDVEMHIYPKGHHGLSLCDGTVSKKEDISDAVKYCSDWVPHCIKWIKEIL